MRQIRAGLEGTWPPQAHGGRDADLLVRSRGGSVAKAQGTDKMCCAVGGTWRTIKRISVSSRAVLDLQEEGSWKKAEREKERDTEGKSEWPRDRREEG